MTFSIVACDPRNGDLGVAVASRFLAAGALVPHARFGAGALATQARARSDHGTRGLDLLSLGRSPAKVIEDLLDGDGEREMRQIAAVNPKGDVFAYTGIRCPTWAGHVVGKCCSAQGNILAGPQVVKSMVETFEASDGRLVDRLLDSLRSGEEAGGDRRGKQSAAVLVMSRTGVPQLESNRTGDKVVDLRVDDHPDPVNELRRIFGLYDSTRLLRPGSRDLVLEPALDVEALQTALKKLGAYRGLVDGYLGMETVDAVRKFASEAGLARPLFVDKSLFEEILRRAG